MKRAFHSFLALALTVLISTAVFAETLTVSGVHANRAELAGKQITVTGKVIKVNNGVMRRNFIHVQDGTGTGELNRLVFTSQQTAVAGDTVTVTGTLALDVDFGMGYFYPTLVQDATLELVTDPKI